MTEKAKTEKLKLKERWTMYPYRLAHHPLCDHFADHVYNIRGQKICRGCVNYYGGIIVGLIVVPIIVVVLHINFWIAFAITNGLFIFTPLTVFLPAPRPLKDISRLMLGIAVVTALTTIVLSIIELVKNQTWLAFIPLLITVTVYFSSRKYFSKLRFRRNEQICRACEQFYLPHCDGMSEDIDTIIANKSRREGDAFSEK